MARITASDVQAIVDTAVSAEHIERFIDLANLLVDRHLNTDEYTWNPGELENIELNLAAHFTTARDPRMQSESLDGFSRRVAGNFGDFLHRTQYGEMAMMLDHTGTLARVKENKKVLLKVLT